MKSTKHNKINSCFKIVKKRFMAIAFHPDKKSVEDTIQTKICKRTLVIFGTLLLLFIPLAIVFRDNIEFAIFNEEFQIKSVDMQRLDPSIAPPPPRLLPKDDPVNNKQFIIRLRLGKFRFQNWKFSVNFPTIVSPDPKLGKQQENFLGKTIKKQISIFENCSFIMVDCFDKSKNINFSLNYKSQISNNYSINIDNYQHIDQNNKNLLIGFTIFINTQNSKFNIFASSLKNEKVYQF